MSNNIHIDMAVKLLHSGNQIDYIVSTLLKEYGLTHVQFNILRILWGAFPEPLSAGDVKDRILFSNSDVTRLIDRMVAKKIVAKNPCKDNRRRMEILITKAGQDLMDEIYPNITSVLNRNFQEKITVKEAKLLIELLDKIN